MGKYFLNSIIIVAFILTGVNAAFANSDKYEIQSLNYGTDIEEENSTSTNMSTIEIEPKVTEPQEAESYTVTPVPVYPYQNPYYNNGTNIQYRIGPYYSTGFNRGFGFNYKGFDYNYKGHGYNYGYSTSNKHPVYLSPPPPPPPPQHHAPMHSPKPHMHQQSGAPPHHKPHHK